MTSLEEMEEAMERVPGTFRRMGEKGAEWLERDRVDLALEEEDRERSQELVLPGPDADAGGLRLYTICV